MVMYNSLEVVVVTNDKEMARLARVNYLDDCKSTGKQIGYVFQTTIPNRTALEKCDAVIYDLDTTVDNDALTVENISKIKFAAPHKPLIVTGDKTDITYLSSSQNVGHLIDRIVAKPLVVDEFEIVIAAAVAKTERFSANVQTEVEKPLFLKTGLGSLVCMITILLFSVYSNRDEESMPVQSVAISQSGSNLFLTEPQVPFQSTQLEIDNLLALAEQAHRDGKLVLPKNGSALYYYRKILLVDRYHPLAYAGNQAVLEESRESLPYLIKDGQLDTVEDLLAVLIDATPFAAQNSALITSYEAARESFDSGNEQTTLDQRPSSDILLPSKTTQASELRGAGKWSVKQQVTDNVINKRVLVAEFYTAHIASTVTSNSPIESFNIANRTESKQ